MAALYAYRRNTTTPRYDSGKLQDLPDLLIIVGAECRVETPAHYYTDRRAEHTKKKRAYFNGEPGWVALDHEALCLVLHRLDSLLLFIQLPHQVLCGGHKAEYLWHPAVEKRQSLHPLTQSHILSHSAQYETNHSGNNTQIPQLGVLFHEMTPL